MPGDQTAKPAKKTPYQKRDVRAQFCSLYPNLDTEDPETRLAPFRAFILKPLAPSTLTRIAAIEKWWITIYADHYKIGEEEARKCSFTKGAAVPEMAFMRLFLEVLHKTGQSKLGLPKVIGLSKRTLLNTFCQVTMARTRSGAEPFTQDFRQQIVKMIHQWAAQCTVASCMKDKYIIRLQDYEDLCGVSISGVHGITDLFMRLQMVILLGILFFTGQRPGAIIEGAGYRGSKQCLLWGRTELVLTGYKPGYGPQFEFVMTLDWVKNMRFDDSKFIVIPLCSLAADKAHIDPLLAIIAHGIELGVWTEDVSRFFGKNPQLPTRFPHPIPVSPEHQDRPLLENTKRTGAMTFSTATYHMARCSGALGFLRKNLYMARDNAALEMGDTQAKHKLQYLMGHTIGSNTGLSSAYQPRQCGLDNTGVMAHEAQNSNLSRLMVSVSYKQHTSDTLSPAEQAQFLQVLASDLDASLEIACEVVQAHDAMVKVLGEDAEDTHPENPLVIEYLEAAVGAEQFFHQALDHCVANPKLVGVRPGEGHTRLLIQVFLPIYEAFQDAVLTKAADAPAELIDGLTSSAFIHPGRGLLKQEDPISSVLDFYRDMLQTGRKYKEGDCIFCQMRHQSTPSSAKQHWGRHLYTCEQQLRSKTETCCHVCMVFIRNPVTVNVNLGISVEDTEYSQHLYDAHHEDCHETLVERFLLGNTVDDRSELDAAHSVQGVGVVAKKGKGKEAEAAPRAKAKVQTVPAYLNRWTFVTRMTIKDMARIWCPVCLFNPNLPWDQRHHVTHSSTKFQYHLVTHFGSDHLAFRTKVTDTHITYNRTHLCYVGACDGEMYTTGAFIEHLHNNHDIPLIQCTRSHTHSPDCYRLQPNFRYFDQAVEEAKHPILELPMPKTCLIDYRRAQSKKNSISRVEERVRTCAPALPAPVAAPVAASVAPPVATPAAASVAPITVSSDYSVKVFCVDFNLTPTVIAKIEAMGSDVFPLGKPFLHKIDESDWNDCGFMEAEHITLLWKHQHLLDSKTLGTSPLPFPPHFYPMLAGTTISNFAKAISLSDVFSPRLKKMGFSLDDPDGMATLLDQAWEVAGFQKKWEISFVRTEYSLYLKEKAQL